MKKKNFADFTENYASLGKNGAIKTLAGGNELWSLSAENLNKTSKDCLITTPQKFLLRAICWS